MGLLKEYFIFCSIYWFHTVWDREEENSFLLPTICFKTSFPGAKAGGWRTAAPVWLCKLYNAYLNDSLFQVLSGYCWGMWHRTGMEIFGHWQTPAWLDLYGGEMRDCFTGVKHRIEKRIRERKRLREWERVPWVLTYIQPTMTDMILKKEACGTLTEGASRSDIITLAVTLSQLHCMSGEWWSP